MAKECIRKKQTLNHWACQIIILFIFGLLLGMEINTNNALAITPIDPSYVIDDGKSITLHGREIAYYNNNNDLVFIPQENSHYNATAFQCLLGMDNTKRTVIIPPSEIHLATNIVIKSNKTILASGATIIEDTKGQLFLNECKDDVYNCLRNVTIVGGIWKNKSTKVTQSVFLFAHANNVIVRDAIFYTNYSGHGFSFVACKNSKLINCKILSIDNSTKKYHCKEEALQLDIATASSAPYVAKQGKKYVEGQCNKNILIKGCTIRGSRGISTSWTKKEKGYSSSFHSNITINDCTIKSVSGEPITIYNCLNYNLTNNKFIVESSKYIDKKQYYSNGISINILAKTNKAKKSKSTISGNTIRGFYHGIFLWSTKGANHGKIIVKNNKISASKKEDCIYMKKYCTSKLIHNTNKKR